MTQQLIAQSIVRAPDFWGTTLRMAIITESVLHTESVITDYESAIPHRIFGTSTMYNKRVQCNTMKNGIQVDQVVGIPVRDCM